MHLRRERREGPRPRPRAVAAAAQARVARPRRQTREVRLRVTALLLREQPRTSPRRKRPKMTGSSEKGRHAHHSEFQALRSARLFMRTSRGAAACAADSWWLCMSGSHVQVSRARTVLCAAVSSSGGCRVAECTTRTAAAAAGGLRLWLWPDCDWWVLCVGWVLPCFRFSSFFPSCLVLFVVGHGHHAHG